MAAPISRLTGLERVLFVVALALGAFVLLLRFGTGAALLFLHYAR
jgi:hypothetical protein